MSDFSRQELQDFEREDERFGTHVHSKAHFGSEPTRDQLELSWNKQEMRWKDYYRFLGVNLTQEALENLKWNHINAMRRRG